MFCTQCGTPLKENRKFCTNCGARPGTEVTAPPRTTSQPSRSATPPVTAARVPVSTSSSAPAIAVTSAEPLASAAAVEAPRPVAVAAPAPSTIAPKPGELEKSIGPSAVSRFLPWLLAALAIVVVVGAFLFYRFSTSTSPRPVSGADIISTSTSPRSVSDADIIHSLQTRFAVDPDLSKCTVKVKSHNGIVTLTGLVNKESDKTIAATIAGQQPGVKQVNIYGLAVSTPISPSSGGETAGSNSVTANQGSPLPTSSPAGDRVRPAVVQAVIEQGTSVLLPAGRLYLFGMVTGGAAPSSPFVTGQYAQATDAAGQISAALAYGTDAQDTYTTKTGYHVIGGASVEGTWDNFSAFHGENSQPGAPNASVIFPVQEESLVVVIGLASSQQSISLRGLPGLQTDAINSGPSASEGIVIAHAYLSPGAYTVVEDSRALAGGQAPNHMADLLGVFVFGAQNGSTPPRVGMAAKTGIHSVDFLNFGYPSDCSQQFDGFGKVIHVSNGQWTKEDVGAFAVGKTASQWMVGYGDLRGDGQDEAVVVTSCQGLANFDYEEIFVFANSSAGVQLLAKLSPSEWGPGTLIHDVHAEKQQLVVGFLEGGSNACPDTLVTARFRWNGAHFVRTGADSKPFKCQ